MSARVLNLPFLQVVKDPFFRKPPRKKCSRYHRENSADRSDSTLTNTNS